MERNLSKNGLLNWVVLALAAVAMQFLARLAGSTTAELSVAFLVVGTLVALVSWFQMRLEAREEAERLEFEDLSTQRSGSALFAASSEDTLHAKRSRKMFEKWMVPAFTLLLFAFEAAAIGWNYQGMTTKVVVEAFSSYSMAAFAGIGLVLFLLGTYSARLARYENHRLLRPGASALLLGSVLCAIAAVAEAADSDFFKYGKLDRYLSWLLLAVLVIVALETLFALVFEVYRPRVQGGETRLVYESRLIGLLGSTGGLFSTAAQTLDYQFGFRVSETWFYKYLEQELGRLALLAIGLLWFGSMFVFVEPQEQALLERFGSPVANRGILEPGFHFKWPWPMDAVHRYPVRSLQSFTIGIEQDESKSSGRTVVWTVQHSQAEYNMLVASRDTTSGTDTDVTKAVPVNLLTVSIPVQYFVKDLKSWMYTHSNPGDLLQRIATREVVRYLVSVDMIDFMSAGRLKAVGEVRTRIQKAADEHRLGVEITFVGLQDVHPPIGNKEIQVAAAFEQEIGAEAQKEAKIHEAYGYRAEVLPRADAEAVKIVNDAKVAAALKIAEAQGAAAQFRGQLVAFSAAPSIYGERLVLDAITRAIAPARKYVVLSDASKQMLQLNLEGGIREDLANQIYIENPNKKSEK